jgi:hypothetical protein
LKLLAHARTRGADVVVVTWPVAGYFDFLLVRLMFGRTPVHVVLHDPLPLEPQPGGQTPGYGRWARSLAGSRLARARAIVHSREARAAAEQCARIRNIVVLPLPMHPPKQRGRRDSEQVVVRVLGQNKADRDATILEDLAVRAQPDWRYEIVGRRWSDVAGWTTVNRYVPETEFEELIQTSSVVLIPYRRFFQSDIAVRSLELGTPIVGPRQSSLTRLVGEDSRWLVSDGEWEGAIDAAVGAGCDEVHAIARLAYEQSREEWAAWLLR